MELLNLVIWAGKVILFGNLIYLIYLVKHLDRYMGLLLVLLLIIFGIDSFSSYLANNGEQNWYLTHYYTLGQFFILSVIYYKLLKRFKRAVPIGVTLLSSVLIYQLADGQILYDQFNMSGYVVSACILISYAFFYYIEFITEKKYWDSYNIGLFLYLGGSSVIFLTMNHWKELAEWNARIWTVNAFLVVIYQVFISITIYRFHRTQKLSNGISSL